MERFFTWIASGIALAAGQPGAFLLAVSVVVVWGITGPIFGWSDTWQLVINTGTTIVTFLMVFLIQNTQNRDMITVQLKLSELVLAMKGAENKFASIEDMTDEELEILHNECRARAEMTLGHLQSRRGEIGDKPSKRTAAHAARHASKSVTRKSRAPKR